MSANRRATPLTMLAATILAAFATIHCGSSGSPTQPANPTLATTFGVALNSTVMAAGNTVQGTVSLAAPALTGGASISLSSSNTAVATVQTSVTVQAGASSATFMVNGIAVGTATITASLNGTSQSPTLTVTADVALSSISFSAFSVVGGNPITGMATLTGAAPAGGAVVTLVANDPVTVPATVTVPAGSTSATFTVSTRAVAGTIASMISGIYGGGSASAVLSVIPPAVATASFGVTGTTTTDTCGMINLGNTLDCAFDGSTSTAPGKIIAWDWTYSVATTISLTTLGPRLAVPPTNCSLIQPPPFRFDLGVSWFTMIVTLTVHDNLGNVSAPAINNDVRLFPQGLCGF